MSDARETAKFHRGDVQFYSSASFPCRGSLIIRLAARRSTTAKTGGGEK